MSKEVFLIDANAFLTPSKQYYRFSIAPGYWEQLNDLSNKGFVKTIDKITKEVCPREDESMKDDVQNWYEDVFQGTIISTKQEEVVEEYQSILNHLHSSEKYSDKAFREWAMNESVADPWLIAVAKAYNYTVVSFETMKIFNGGTPLSSAKIPNICQDLNVPYTNLFSMMEELNIQL